MAFRPMVAHSLALSILTLNIKQSKPGLSIAYWERSVSPNRVSALDSRASQLKALNDRIHLFPLEGDSDLFGPKRAKSSLRGKYIFARFAREFIATARLSGALRAGIFSHTVYLDGTGKIRFTFVCDQK